MSVWNKILLGLLFIACLVFFHAATRTLKTYQYWAGKADEFQKKLKERNDEILTLQTADHEHPSKDKTIGVQQLRIDLKRVLANRGRIWTHCDRQKIDRDPKNPSIMLVTLNVESNAFSTKMVLYAFEEGDDLSPGKYLGEFRVSEVSTTQIVLASTTPMFDPLAENVAKSKGGWVLYEMMPADEHEAFANLPEDQRKWVSDEYLKDGQPIDANGQVGQDPKDKKFERPLRKYLPIFRSCELYRTLYADRKASILRDKEYLDAADKQSKAQEAQVEQEKARVEKELQRAQAEHAAVANLLAARKYMVAQYREIVRQEIDRNFKYWQEIAERQRKAAEEIERRLQRMAQYGPRTN